MPKRIDLLLQSLQSSEHLGIPDAKELTPRELADEHKAHQEELAKRRWMSEPASAIVRRVPVSVFAMGALAGLA